MFHVDVSNNIIKDVSDFVLNTCQQKAVNGGGRHLIVINIVDKLKTNVALAIKSIINKYTNNALFIIRNDNGHYIDQHIFTSCQIVRLTINHELFHSDFRKAIGLEETATTSGYTDPMNMCIAFEYQADVDPLSTFVNHHMDNLINTLSNPTSTVDTYGKALREYCIKVGASCISIATLGHYMITWMQNNSVIDNELATDIIHEIAMMEHMTKCVTKPLFALEHHVDEIIQKIYKRANRSET